MADLTLKVGADIGQFNAELSKVSKKLDSMGSDLKKVAGEISIGGVTMGRAFAALANPVTAVAAAVAALGAAYANSTIGAKDLEFAHNQLAAATGLLSNEMAKLISGTEDGEGFFSGLANGILTYFNPALAASSLSLAYFKEQLEDLNREGITAMGNFQEALADNQGLLTEINDEQTNWIRQGDLINQALGNIYSTSAEVLRVKEVELKVLKDQVRAQIVNEALDTAIAEKTAEILKYKKLIARQTGALTRMEDNLEKKETARISKLQKENELLKVQEAIIRNIVNPIKIGKPAGLGSPQMPGLLPFDDSFGKPEGETGKALYEWNNLVQGQMKQVQIDLAPAFTDLTLAFTDGFTDAAMGIKGSGAKMLGALGSIMGQFGAMMVAAGFAGLGLKKLTTTPGFAIAAGLALVALSKAVTKRASSMMASAGSGGGGGSERFDGSRGYVSGETQDVNLSGRVIVEGQQLAIVLDNYNRRNRYTKGG